MLIHHVKNKKHPQTRLMERFPKSWLAPKFAPNKLKRQTTTNQLDDSSWSYKNFCWINPKALETVCSKSRNSGVMMFVKGLKDLNQLISYDILWYLMISYDFLQS